MLKPFRVNTSLLLLITTIISIVGCSGNYTFESNIKPGNAKEYFSVSEVKIFEDESEFNAAYQFVGLVEGDDCQEKPHLAPPDPINARTKARKEAYAKQANAVIFTSCINIENNFCTAQVVCYGKAYRLGKPNEQ